MDRTNDHFLLFAYNHSVRRNLAYFAPVIDLGERVGAPMYRRLYDGFRTAIVDGRIRPGQRVPSSRGLAAELGISRISVLSAYAQLLSEGYFETSRGAGTSVARTIPDESLATPTRYPRRETRARTVKQGQRRVSRLAAASARMPVAPWCEPLGAFRVSLPALDHFPLAQWAKLVARNARHSGSADMAYGDAMGHPPFREAIGSIWALPVASGATPPSHRHHRLATGAGILARVLLNPGDAVSGSKNQATPAPATPSRQSAEVVPIPLDQAVSMSTVWPDRPNPRGPRM